MKRLLSGFRFYDNLFERKEKRRHIVPALVGGVALGLGFPPVPMPFLMFIGLIPYLYVIERRQGLAEINRITYFTFFIFNLVTLYWVGSWTRDADPFLLIAGTVLMFFNPLLFLIPSTLYYHAKKRLGKNTSLLLLPVFWAFYEYMYTVTDFRFPWLTLGNGLVKFNLFIQIADVIGVYGLTLLIIFINIGLYKAWNNRATGEGSAYLPAVFSLALIAVPLIYGIVKHKESGGESEKIKVGLIQPNLNPWKKWEAGNLNEQLDLYLSLSREAVLKGAELIVWPESALPVYLMTGAYSLQVNRIYKFLDTNNVLLLTGMPDATFYGDSLTAPEDAKKTSSGKFYTSYNSILFFQPHNRSVKKYGKIMLVPFGEKVPLVEQIPFLGELFRWNVGISSWNTGKEITVFQTTDKRKIAGVICIESIYPDFVASFVSKGAELIAVVTNDSWYGNSSGPYQHRDFAILRAVENRRSVVRAANGGVSCLIDPLGKIVQQTSMFTEDVLVAEAELNGETTFYTRYPRLIPYICLLITSVFILYILYGKIIKRK
ncbi:MAG: apolipoprotein N-acyltransferase [Melioribacteraceae bacterium]|nr:apolipoprotein N-acyltransferase [Melioribacteraceae bacterium]